MGRDIKTVAVCTGSPALTAILSAVLAGRTGLRVRQFESKGGLTTYMRLAPVSLLVCDIGDAQMVAALRRDERLVLRDVEVIALTRTLTRHERQIAAMSGIDEVILKPMSPSYLFERVMYRLDRTPEDRDLRSAGPLAAYRRISDNVVQLFPHSWQPNS